MLETEGPAGPIKSEAASQQGELHGGDAVAGSVIRSLSYPSVHLPVGHFLLAMPILLES